jgi:hypothetical protein
VVERDLAKVDVAGSTPVSRSRNFVGDPDRMARRVDNLPSGLLTLFLMARYPSGKGEVCKTFIRRFDSDPRLHSSFLLI